MIRSARARKGVLAAAMAAVSLAGLAACEDGPGRYSPYEAGVPAHVERGRIESFRPVHFRNGQTGGNTVAGAVGGGVVGSIIGGDRRGPSLAGGLVGAAVGGLLANGVSRAGDSDGFSYIVDLNNGRTLEVAQPDRYPINIGQRVDVIFGPRVRLVPVGGAYGPPPPPPPPRY